MAKKRASRPKQSKTPAVSLSAEASPAASTPQPASSDELLALVLKACLIARDSVFNVRDFLTNGSRMAFLAIKDCEKELDQIERKVDERLPGAITRVGQVKARQLLACLKFITDLERIGDLAYSAVMQLHARPDVQGARKILRVDPEVDRVCHALFQRHLADTTAGAQNFDILLMAQALERIGDHAKNLAEELIGLAEGRSLRHTAKKLNYA